MLDFIYQTRIYNGHMKFMEDIFYAVRNVLSAVLNACLQKLFNSNQTLPLEISMSINIIRAAYFRGLLTLHDFKN